MPQINILSKDVCELIAAGEVVERPASVVKEMVENSIDAGASSITVEIQNGGISLIRVSDNGCGIAHSEVKKAFVNHATSKIVSADDLSSVYTLGFRGEALSSICAVSKVQMLTKTKDEDCGTEYVIEGGSEVKCESVGCPDGTTIVVRNLFYNVPARMKFLKRDVTEGNCVSDVVDKLALSHPEISFRLIRDSKSVLFTPGGGDLSACIHSIFGASFLDSLIYVNQSVDGISASGYISKPVSCRGSRSMQYFYINSRTVRSKGLTASFENAYKNSIMVGKFPACVLNISIPADTVDVNIHPSKAEVRFSDERKIFSALYFASKGALQNFSERPAFDFNKVTKFSEPSGKQMPIEPDPSFSSAKAQPSENFWEHVSFNKVNKVSDVPFKPYETKENDEPDLLSGISLNNFKRQENDESKKFETPAQNEPQDEFLYIGEAFKTYLICQFNGKLCLIDKHAAHERIIFNKLKKEYSNPSSQLLLAPIAVGVSKMEHDVILENSEIFKGAGFEIEDFGENTIMVRRRPMILEDDDVEDVVLEISTNLSSGKIDAAFDTIDSILHTVACKAAIKAGNKNSSFELSSLAKQVCLDDEVRYCPHGRPVLIEMSQRDLEKQFKRIVS